MRRSFMVTPLCLERSRLVPTGRRGLLGAPLGSCDVEQGDDGAGEGDETKLHVLTPLCLERSRLVPTGRRGLLGAPLGSCDVEQGDDGAGEGDETKLHVLTPFLRITKADRRNCRWFGEDSALL